MGLSEALAELRGCVRAAVHTVDDEVVRAVRRLARCYEEDPEWRGRLLGAVPDAGVRESLLHVRSDGEPVPWPEGLDPIHPAGAAEPWIHPVAVDGGEQTLVARWLAHWAGIRHRAVHLFLDHPSLDGYTFLQLRSFAKCGYPGCFDIPVGGHPKAAATAEDTLEQETREELNLEVGRDVVDLSCIARYDYVEPEPSPAFHDVEFRTAYRGRLSEDAWARIRFDDGEVAALCLFSRGEVERLIETRPHEVASGLHGSFPHYLAHHAAGKPRS